MPHRKLYDYCQITYWQDGVAAKEDEDWTECTVQSLNQSWLELRFKNTPEDLYKLQNLMALLSQVYEIGQKKAFSDLRSLIGVPEWKR